MLSIRSHYYIKALSVITAGFVVFVGIGVLVTRLIVHDLVDTSMNKCGDTKAFLWTHQDNPLERIAMLLGESRAVAVSETDVTLESFTIYHIPLGILRGQLGMRVMIECLPAHEDTEAPVDVTWGTYINKELGISMEIPLDKNNDQLIGGVGKGDTGTSTQVTINLPSGSVIYGYAATGDYSAPKGAPGVGDEGYVVKDGRYYVITRGIASQVEFTPDTIWETNDGSSVFVRYRKKAEELIDYPIPFIQVMVNIPNSIFTGIGFIVVGHGTTQEIVSDDDIETLKKIVSTIKYI